MRKAKAKSDLERSTIMEEVSLRQKPRTLWLREDDKCTRFFHRMTNSNRINNSIKSLIVDDTISTDYFEINEHIVQFYNNLYTERLSWRPNLNGLSFESIGEVEAN